MVMQLNPHGKDPGLVFQDFPDIWIHVQDPGWWRLSMDHGIKTLSGDCLSRSLSHGKNNFKKMGKGPAGNVVVRVAGSHMLTAQFESRLVACKSCRVCANACPKSTENNERRYCSGATPQEVLSLSLSLWEAYMPCRKLQKEGEER